MATIDSDSTHTSKLSEAKKRLSQALDALAKKNSTQENQIRLYKETCEKANDELKMHMKHLSRLID